MSGRQIMTADDVRRALIRISHEIVEKHAGTEGLAERDQDDGASMVGRFGARSRVRHGEKIDVTVDTRALHFFDPETGLGIYDGDEREATNG